MGARAGVAPGAEHFRCQHRDCEIVVAVVVAGRILASHGRAVPKYCSRHNQPWKRASR